MRETVSNIARQWHGHCLRVSHNKRNGWGRQKVSLTRSEKKMKAKGDGTMNSKRNDGVILVGDGMVLGE